MLRVDWSNSKVRILFGCSIENIGGLIIAVVKLLIQPDCL